MTLGRRRIFGLGALGFGAAAAQACGGSLGGTGAPLGPLEIDRLLLELDEVVAQLEALEPDAQRFGIRRDGPELDAEKKRCLALLGTLCFLGTYRHVPESTWDEPRVAAHLERTLPRIRATLARARQHLLELPDDEAEAIDARFEADPELPMRIMEQVDDYAKQLDVPLEQRTYLRLSTAELAARFRQEGARAVTSKLASSFDRLHRARLAQLGMPADSARAPFEAYELADLEQVGSTSDMRPRLAKTAERPVGEAGESCIVHEDCESDLRCMDDVCTPKGRSKLVKDAAGDMAFWGLVFLIPPLCGIGVLILLQSMFVAIVGGVITDERS